MSSFPHGLAADATGEGTPVILLHGLTATSRYVVMGSRSLERSGHRVIAYDARGHGRSLPASDHHAYTYDDLGEDVIAVLDSFDVGAGVLVGVSMGAHTALWLALRHPERVAGLVVITPGHHPDSFDDTDRLTRWDALADGLERGGVEGFLAAYGRPAVAERWVEPVVRAIRQRMALHEHPGAVADALRVVPRSRPFSEMGELEAIRVPTAVIASSDEADPEHPQALAEAYAAAIPGARLLVDEEGRSPRAWQGSQVSRVVAELTERAF